MDQQPILVTGVTGQVGSAVLKILGSKAIGLRQSDCDFSRPESIYSIIKEIKPRAVINAAAYTQVDKAESERDLAFKINAASPEVIARYCADHDLPFIHFSTDYVYSGAGSHFMTESEPLSPCNYYGESKLEGDQRIAKIGGKYIIFRTCWVYDANGRNFLNTILRLASEREELKIVNDQLGSPSFAGNVAEATVKAFDIAKDTPEFPAGVFHLCNSEITSWFVFGCDIIRNARDLGATFKVKDIRPIYSEEFKTVACRPKNSRLSMEKLKRVFGISIPSWQDGLKQCLQEKYASHRA